MKKTCAICPAGAYSTIQSTVRHCVSLTDVQQKPSLQTIEPRIPIGFVLSALQALTADQLQPPPPSPALLPAPATWQAAPMGVPTHSRGGGLPRRRVTGSPHQGTMDIMVVMGIAPLLQVIGL